MTKAAVKNMLRLMEVEPGGRADLDQYAEFVRQQAEISLCGRDDAEATATSNPAGGRGLSGQDDVENPDGSTVLITSSQSIPAAYRADDPSARVQDPLRISSLSISAPGTRSGLQQVDEDGNVVVGGGDASNVSSVAVSIPLLQLVNDGDTDAHTTPSSPRSLQPQIRRCAMAGRSADSEVASTNVDASSLLAEEPGRQSSNVGTLSNSADTIVVPSARIVTTPPAAGSPLLQPAASPAILVARMELAKKLGPIIESHASLDKSLVASMAANAVPTPIRVLGQVLYPTDGTKQQDPATPPEPSQAHPDEVVGGSPPLPPLLELAGVTTTTSDESRVGNDDVVHIKPASFAATPDAVLVPPSGYMSATERLLRHVRNRVSGGQACSDSDQDDDDDDKTYGLRGGCEQDEADENSGPRARDEDVQSDQTKEITRVDSIEGRDCGIKGNYGSSTTAPPCIPQRENGEASSMAPQDVGDGVTAIVHEGLGNTETPPEPADDVRTLKAGATEPSDLGVDIKVRDIHIAIIPKVTATQESGDTLEDIKLATKDEIDTGLNIGGNDSAVELWEASRGIAECTTVSSQRDFAVEGAQGNGNPLESSAVAAAGSGAEEGRQPRVTIDEDRKSSISAQTMLPEQQEDMTDVDGKTAHTVGDEQLESNGSHTLQLPDNEDTSGGKNDGIGVQGEIQDVSDDVGDEQGETEPAWIEGYDASHDCYYYHHVATGESSWYRPDAPYEAYVHSDEEDAVVPIAEGNVQRTGRRGGKGTHSSPERRESSDHRSQHNRGRGRGSKHDQGARETRSTSDFRGAENEHDGKSTTGRHGIRRSPSKTELFRQSQSRTDMIYSSPLSSASEGSSGSRRSGGTVRGRNKPRQSDKGFLSHDSAGMSGEGRAADPRSSKTALERLNDLQFIDENASVSEESLSDTDWRSNRRDHRHRDSGRPSKMRRNHNYGRKSGRGSDKGRNSARNRRDEDSSSS